MTMNKKLTALLVCAVVIVIGAASATMAYLTDDDADVNTMTVGHVDISLDEADVNLDGTPTDSTDRVKENTYKLIPGSTYTKDPIIHVAAGSEDCWLFVTVDNQITAIEGTPTIASQMEDEGWTEIGTYKELPVYAYKTTVKEKTDVIVFERFTVDGDKATDELLNDNDGGYEGKQVIIKAYAIQAAGFDTAEEAWESAKSQLK